jgi:hypothetical protein
MGYERDIKIKWKYLRQKQAQKVEEHTTKFHPPSIKLQIVEGEKKLVLKYVGGLHSHIQKELSSFDINTLDDAYTKSKYVEAKVSWLKGISKEDAPSKSSRHKVGQKF